MRNGLLIPLVLLCISLTSCGGSRAPESSPVDGSGNTGAGAGGLVGGTGAEAGGSMGTHSSPGGAKSSADYDAMVDHQKRELERQRKELDDIRRQKLYDEKYRRFESQHSR